MPDRTPTMHQLTEQQMNRRLRLFGAWSTGYTGGKIDEEISKLAAAFFAIFIAGKHPDLVLSKAEKGMTDCFKPLSAWFPDGLDGAIEARLPVASKETGVHSDMLRAVVYGVATMDLSKNGSRDVQIIFRNASLAILKVAENL